MNRILFLTLLAVPLWALNGQAAQENAVQTALQPQTSEISNPFDRLPNEMVAKVLDHVVIYDPVSRGRSEQVDKRFQELAVNQGAYYNSNELRDSINNFYELFQNTDLLKGFSTHVPLEDSKWLNQLIVRANKLQPKSLTQNHLNSFNSETMPLKDKKTIILKNSLQENRDLNSKRAELVKEMQSFIIKYKDSIDNFKLHLLKEKKVSGAKYEVEQLKNSLHNLYSDITNLRMDNTYLEHINNLVEIIEGEDPQVVNIQEKYIEKFESAPSLEILERLDKEMKQEVNKYLIISREGKEESFYDIQHQVEIAVNERKKELKKMEDKILVENQFHMQTVPAFLDSQEKRVEMLERDVRQEKATPIISKLEKQKTAITHLRQENEKISNVLEKGYFFTKQNWKGDFEKFRINAEKNPVAFLNYLERVEEKLKDLNISPDMTLPSFPELDRLEQQIKDHAAQNNLELMKTELPFAKSEDRKAELSHLGTDQDLTEQEHLQEKREGKKKAKEENKTESVSSGGSNHAEGSRSATEGRLKHEEASKTYSIQYKE